MASTGPRTEVFTTVLVKEDGAVADWERHDQRMRQHAQRLRLTLPSETPPVSHDGEEDSWQLARVATTGQGTWEVRRRPLVLRNEEVDDEPGEHPVEDDHEQNELD